MTPDTIRELLAREPFQPFILTLSSGEQVKVSNPDLVVPMKSQMFVAFPDDTFRILSWLHVASARSLRPTGHVKQR